MLSASHKKTLTLPQKSDSAPDSSLHMGLRYSEFLKFEIEESAIILMLIIKYINY
jgi:hypothetical protein